MRARPFGSGPGLGRGTLAQDVAHTEAKGRPERAKRVEGLRQWSPGLARGAQRLSEGPFGYFDAARREYVITRPDTPTPWINYLGSEAYCAMLSNTAGGYSFHRDPRDRRLLRFRYNNLPADRPGRYLFVRDEGSATFWSLSWQPVCPPPARYRYECRHGRGYTIIRSSYHGIEAAVTYLVPLGANLEIWAMTLRNTTRRTRRLSVFSYAEFCVLQADADMTDFQYTLNIARAERRDQLLLHLTNYFPRAGRSDLTFFGVDRPLSGFDCDRETFIGPYRSEACPQVVTEGRAANSVASGGNPIGSHWIRLTLPPGRSASAHFVLGTAQSPTQAQRLVQRYASAEASRRELERLQGYWEDATGRLTVQTPDPEVDELVNVWTAYQCRTTFNWSRSASYYESGIGRGIGYRDTNQDTLGVVHAIPDKVRERIVQLARNQFAQGDAYHQYFPLTGRGDKTGYSDDHLWLIVSTAAYLKETGELAFLETPIPFVDGPNATLYEHLRRALAYSYAQTGPHKLPLIGYADWNDCLNLDGPNHQAESVWVAQLLYAVTQEVIELARRTGRVGEARVWEAKARRLRRTVNTVAWDGRWFIRAFDDRRRPIGSRRCREGKIHLNAQSWAVLSGIADGDRGRQCMDAVRKHLDTPHGIRLTAPPYRAYDSAVGAVGTFAPGLKENGGIFCHANPWAVIAEALLKRADQAFAYYKQIAPTTRNKIADIHQAEGYVYAQFIAASPHRDEGRARNSWLTGSATWNYVAITQYLLGVRPTHDGLLVDPCLPSPWSGFRMRRVFRGATYDITVRRDSRQQGEAVSVRVDGAAHRSQILPVFTDRGMHRVDVVMGCANNNHLTPPPVALPHRGNPRPEGRGVAFGDATGGGVRPNVTERSERKFAGRTKQHGGGSLKEDSCAALAS